VCIFFSLTTNCVHNCFCERRVVCITFSIRQVMRITYVEKKIWKRRKKKNKKCDRPRGGAWDGAACAVAWSDCTLKWFWHVPVVVPDDVFREKAWRRRAVTLFKDGIGSILHRIRRITPFTIFLLEYEYIFKCSRILNTKQMSQIWKHVRILTWFGRQHLPIFPFFI
jgi:hypothetical protein